MKEAKKRYAQYLNRRYGDRSTPYHYLRDLEMFIQEIGLKAPKSVKAQDISQFVDGQLARGLAASTINRRTASLHTFFEFLASEKPDEIWPNPVNRRLHTRRQPTYVPRDAKEDVVAQLFAAVDKARDRAIFGLMVGAGLRVGEVVDLRLSHLQAGEAGRKTTSLRVMGKGRKERLVWLTPYWTEILDHWLGERPDVPDEHIFLNQHNRQLTVAGVQYLLCGYAKVADIAITCHQLRHTFARRLAEERMPTESIGKLLGHSQLTTTQRYTAGADPELRDAFLENMARLEPIGTQSDPTTPPPIPSGQRQTEQADLQALAQADARLTPLPLWLRRDLSAYLHRRWSDWTPHRAAPNADRLSRQLLSLWGWIIDEYALTGWNDLRRSQVEGWLDALIAQGLQTNTRRSYLSLLFGSLRYLADRGTAIDPNIFRIPYPKRTQPLPRFLPADDYQRLLETVLAQTAADTPRQRLDRTWFLVLLRTGIRTAELLDLRLSDLDLSGRRLLIHSSKNFHGRVVFLTPDLSAALTTYLAQRPHTDDDHLWIDKGQPLLSARVRYCFDRWSHLAQVKVSAHCLRHTLATYLVNQGMSIQAIAKLLGHRSLNTTQQYARLLEPTVKKQFLTAMSQIEGISVPDWPSAHLLESTNLAQTCDSV